MSVDLCMKPTIPKMLQDSGIRSFADLFCGIGGFHYAAADLGMDCVFAGDRDEDCRSQYHHSLGILPAADIRRIKADDVPDYDILFAGFLCQPFAIIGSMKGLHDDRGGLFREMVRILQTKQPKAIVLEQVVSGLTDAGYECSWKILNALDHGLPQKRERVIIVGLLDGLLDLFD